MASRFRLTSDTTAPAVSPALQSYTHNAPTTVRRKLLTKDSSALSTIAYNPDAADDLVAGDSLHCQFVSEPMAAGVNFTSGDVIKYCLQCLEANAGNNVSPQLFVSVVNRAGDTVQRTLRSKVREDAAEMATSLTSRFHTTTQSGATYTTVAGDRLVIEFSYQGTPTAAGGVQGHNASIRYGSAGAGGDLAEDDTQTGTTLNPWIEFVPTIIWEISDTESLTVVVTEGEDIASLLSPTDSDKVQLTEAFATSFLFAPAESLAVRLSEAFDVQITDHGAFTDIFAADSIAIRLSESIDTIVSSLVPIDSVGIRLNEVIAIASQLAAVDSVVVNVSEFGLPQVQVGPADSVTVRISEQSATSATGVQQDSVRIGISEVAESLISFQVRDNQTVQLLEVANVVALALIEAGGETVTMQLTEHVEVVTITPVTPPVPDVIPVVFQGGTVVWGAPVTVPRMREWPQPLPKQRPFKVTVVASTRCEARLSLGLVERVHVEVWQEAAPPPRKEIPAWAPPVRLPLQPLDAATVSLREHVEVYKRDLELEELLLGLHGIDALKEGLSAEQAEELLLLL